MSAKPEQHLDSWSRYSQSSQTAIAYAVYIANNRSSNKISQTSNANISTLPVKTSARDLLEGLVFSHSDRAEPVILSRHFQFPASWIPQIAGPDITNLVLKGRDGILSQATIERNFDEECAQILERAMALAEEFNSEEKGLVHFKSFFGGFLFSDTSASDEIFKMLAANGISKKSFYEVYVKHFQSSGSDFSALLQVEFPSSKTSFAGFQADTPAGDDLLFIRPEIDAFAYLLSAKSLLPPVAFGLFGDWGSGKSFFMEFLRRRVNEITETARKSDKAQKDISIYKRIVQVDFNAWHYVEGNLWASLVEYIFQNLKIGEADTDDLLLIRQNEVLSKIKNFRKDQAEIAVLIRDRESELALAKEVLNEKKSEYEKKKSDLSLLKPADIFSLVIDGEERKRIEEKLQIIGLPDGLKSGTDFLQAFDELKLQIQRGGGLRALFLKRGWTWVAAVGGVIAVLQMIGFLPKIFEMLNMTPLATAMTSASAIIAGMAALLRIGTSEIKKGLDRVEHAKAKLEEILKTKLRDNKTEIEILETDITRISVELSEAQSKESEIRNSLTLLKTQLESITPVGVLKDFIQDRTSSEDYRKFLGVPALIRRDFERLSKLVHQSNQDCEKIELAQEKEKSEHRFNRIILYIDDLDRCPPQRVVEVLQAVHLLLAFDLFVVVVAVDQRWLSQALKEHYKKMLSSGDNSGQSETGDDSESSATPHDYLEKIFQVPFWIKPLDADARKKLIAGIIDQGKMSKAGFPKEVLNNQTGQQLASSRTGESPVPRINLLNPESLVMENSEDEFLASLSPLLGNTPRSIKRFLNVYRLIKAIELNRNGNFMVEKRLPMYKQALLLLAIQTGLESLSKEWIIMVSRLKTEERYSLENFISEFKMDLSGQQLREIVQLEDWLNQKGNEDWAGYNLAESKELVKQIARFSFRRLVD